MEEIIISVFEKFYDKDVIIQKTFEIETKLYDRIEFLSDINYTCKCFLIQRKLPPAPNKIAIANITTITKF